MLPVAVPYIFLHLQLFGIAKLSLTSYHSSYVAVLLPHILSNSAPVSPLNSSHGLTLYMCVICVAGLRERRYGDHHVVGKSRGQPLVLECVTVAIYLTTTQYHESVYFMFFLGRLLRQGPMHSADHPKRLTRLPTELVYPDAQKRELPMESSTYSF
ncbi:hypothetical protein BDV37DRAFT_146765 [Aspergillus pseudonomiae]|uniref:Uncharacterized protein n=1 Tax=Aspergillus pseudonomiae TaxID=1506151 RepID=A0A5N7DA00_9EURO|nr:uncharacterized protein BDV37DRAFT_146765 [Aspergillus pseudonomiae]KAE8403157.1 hypothetical protein BDV37DRAFT_146765 [Aspergillus pseudonomiae]